MCSDLRRVVYEASLLAGLCLPAGFPTLLAVSGPTPESATSGPAKRRIIAPNPPMGWNAWNCFGGEVSEVKIKAIADAMVASGMKDAGNQYVVIADVWHKGRVKGFAQ